MSYKNFFISDTHFGHKNIITFTDNEDKLIRPFKTIEEHDETIIKNWNSVVRDFDRVYVMGDVAINRKHIHTLGRCKGKKVLIKGNHDIFKLNDYTPYFKDIRAYKIYPKYGLIFSHIPIHPDGLKGRFTHNLHGHYHANNIDDKRYINLCCEKINFTPVELNDILKNLGIEGGSK